MNNAILRHVATLHPSEIMTPFDAIMDEYGFDAVCTIVDVLGGATVYIPSKRTVFLGCLAKEARKEFATLTYKDLTKKYGFTERQLRRIFQNGK
ncbi:MAG: hypothetical protein FWB88_11265 [Defluviitaleaceae bacterium]|nr:hypothetical protein [Defluviitaleaceae bacterium]MCL2240213.1 hypothetical protein [Defluviitaleaceae bacterium]